MEKDKNIAVLQEEFRISEAHVEAVVRLLDDGATIPFIARYRKEATGSLDETVLTDMRDRLAQLRALEKRRETIVKSLEEQGVLDEELKARIQQAQTMAALEDLYLPYRPKRRTRASMAREKGLEPLAKLLWEQTRGTEPQVEARAFVSGEKQVTSEDDALAGARDIMAEWASEDAKARAAVRELFVRRGTVQASVVAGKETEGMQYRDYFDWNEPLEKAPSHRVLALLRGEREGFLQVRIAPPHSEASSLLEARFVQSDGPASEQVKEAVRDGLKRLLLPSLETEMKQRAKERADAEAIGVFADNLRHLLMAAPLGPKRVMAIDPGFRTGCKAVCLDAQGKLLHSETVFPHSGDQKAGEASERLTDMVKGYGIQAVAIGNGTAGRETEAFVRKLGLPSEVQVVLVDESGASVYSASAVAREEFPDRDITVRGAVSIGRRLMDPLAELVKIDPKSIGVGQYQHDVDQKELKKTLDDVVMSCVNAVGVEVNTASPHLLAYVSGVGPGLARNIVGHRDANGPFKSRKELRKVSRLGPKAFEQAAGFLRIRNGDNPLDGSAVHPESYSVVEAMAGDLGCSVSELMADAELRGRIDPRRYLTEQTGLPTLNDILEELAKPGRDPRDAFEPFAFASGIESPEDLQAGMKLPGIVTNVTAFGAFVDIGVHRDGLVHVSELSDKFVGDPREVVRVHQQVTVTVLEVDLERNRISLSMKERPGESGKRAPAPSSEKLKKARKAGKSRAAGDESAFNNPFARALKDWR